MIQNYFQADQVAAFVQWQSWARNYLIVTHISPDGDAIGSSLAMMHYLKSMNKNATVMVPNAFPDYFLKIDGAEEIKVFDESVNQLDIINRADVIICLDFNDANRLGALNFHIIDVCCNKIMIDHHLHPQNFCDSVLSVPSASSTCELVYHFLCAIGKHASIDKKVAQSLYLGMMTDTGCFSYNSNNPDIFLIVSDLLSKGVDKDFLYRTVNNNYSENRMKLMGYALCINMKLYKEGQVALITLSDKELKRFNYQPGDSEGFVNLPLQILGVKMSVLIREDKSLKQHKVSARSVGDIPCNEFMANYFNGGGHKNAAGGEFAGTMTNVVKIFEKSIEEWEPLNPAKSEPEVVEQ